MKPDRLNFQFNLAFDLGFPKFTDPDCKHYATFSDRISDLEVLFGNNLLKPEWPPSSDSSTVHMPSRQRLQLPLWKMWPTTNCMNLSLPRQTEWKLCVMWSCPIQKPVYTLGSEELQLIFYHIRGYSIPIDLHDKYISSFVFHSPQGICCVATAACGETQILLWKVHKVGEGGGNLLWGKVQVVVPSRVC